jgi:hypothetical protein
MWTQFEPLADFANGLPSESKTLTVSVSARLRFANEFAKLCHKRH